MSRKAKVTPVAAPVAINLTALKVAEIVALVLDDKVYAGAAAAELTRRIDQRAAAGKHPMPFVITARDDLLQAA